MNKMFIYFAVIAILSCAYAAETKSACKLPPQPKNGAYKLPNNETPDLSKAYDSVTLNYTCDSGYEVKGNKVRLCVQGIWSDAEPECVRACKLKPNPSVNYMCPGSGSSGLQRCDELVSDGTTVQAQCANGYYTPVHLANMNCINGLWNYIATCLPDCGTITPEGTRLRRSVDGTGSKAPWHVTIYTKIKTPYLQICGGSLVSSKVALSAAHCFWDNVNNRPWPASNYAIALSKSHRGWNATETTEVQKSDITDIKIPARFRGSQTNYQEDLAVVTLTTEIVFSPAVKPVCLDFDHIFEKQQLKSGAMGVVPSWNLPDLTSDPSNTLKVKSVPYIPIDTCLNDSPPSFREFITADKICAGFQYGTTFCKGDGGSGISFPNEDLGVTRYYLRGILSIGPINEDGRCTEFSTFTQVSKHEHFIKEIL